MKLRFLLLACCLLWSLPAHAGDIYRWADEQGKVHLSDTVPEKYRKGAVRVDLRPASAPAASRPAKKGDDCATLRRLYQESLDCFAPYVMANGATKAEAFQKCTVRADPAPLCGVAR